MPTSVASFESVSKIHWSEQSAIRSSMKSLVERVLLRDEVGERESPELDRTVAELKEEAARAGIGSAAKAVLRTELMQMRKRIQEREALRKIQAEGGSKEALMANLFFLTSAGREDAVRVLQGLKFDDAQLESLRIRTIDASLERIGSSQPSGKSESAKNIFGPIRSVDGSGYKKAMFEVRQLFHSGHEWSGASEIAKELGLPIHSVQCALEDLSEVGFLESRYFAARSSSGGHWHRSREVCRWQELLEHPVRCLECSTWFSVEATEVFAEFRSKVGNSKEYMAHDRPHLSP